MPRTVSGGQFRCPAAERSGANCSPGGQVVALEGELHDAAEFASWGSARIPQHYALIFWDQGYTNDVPLTESTSPEELAEPFALSK